MNRWVLVLGRRAERDGRGYSRKLGSLHTGEASDEVLGDLPGLGLAVLLLVVLVLLHGVEGGSAGKELVAWWSVLGTEAGSDLTRGRRGTRQSAVQTRGPSLVREEASRRTY